MRRSRRECIFVSDHTTYSRKLSNGERDHIMRRAITLEKATRPRGCHNGLLGRCAIDTLRALLYDFLNMADGLCHPSISKLTKAMREKGLRWSRSAVFAAIAALERAGILKRTQRHKRAFVTIGGLLRKTTVQQSNLYAFFTPLAHAHLLSRRRRVQPEEQRVARLLANLGRSLAFDRCGTGSTRRTGPEETNLFFFSGAFGEGFSVRMPIG
jgi:hypothetical protein